MIESLEECLFKASVHCQRESTCQSSSLAGGRPVVKRTLEFLSIASVSSGRSIRILGPITVIGLPGEKMLHRLMTFLAEKPTMRQKHPIERNGNDRRESDHGGSLSVSFVLQCLIS